MHCRCFNRIRDSRGFTLIEVIVSLVVAAILGTIIYTFIGSTVVQSANPVLLAQKGAYLNGIIENMTGDYKLLMATSTSPMATFIGKIGVENTGELRSVYSDGLACSSNATHCYTIVDNHRISFPPGTPATETADNAGKIIKVTVKYQGLSVTALFAE